MQYTVCHCNHLTAFSSMMVPPNPLPRLTLALFKEGYVLFVVVGSILGLYLVGLVVLRKFDKKDELKVDSHSLTIFHQKAHYSFVIGLFFLKERETSHVNQLKLECPLHLRGCFTSRISRKLVLFCTFLSFFSLFQQIL